MNKVAFLINSLSAGGAEKVLTLILTELLKQGKDIELICLSKENFYKLPTEIKISYLGNNNKVKSGIRKFIDIPILAWKLSKYVKKYNINIVQSHLYRSNYINCLSKIFNSNHLVQIVNTGAISRYKNSGLLGKVNLFLIKRLYGMADLIILKSKGMQNDMHSLFNFTNKQIVINNPYDIDKINLLKKEEVSDFVFDENKKYLISIGRFETFKRQDYIIKSLTKLDENVELLLIGDGHKKEELKSLVSSMNIERRVHFLGKVENPYKYLSRSDLFILSSDNGEGFPNVLIEAMICNIPAISSDCISGPREILAPNSDVEFQLKNGIELCEYGVLFPVGKVDCLVSSINILLNDFELQQKYVNNANNMVNNFSLEKIILKYKDVLEYNDNINKKVE